MVEIIVSILLSAGIGAIALSIVFVVLSLLRPKKSPLVVHDRFETTISHEAINLLWSLKDIGGEWLWREAEANAKARGSTKMVEGREVTQIEEMDMRVAGNRLTEILRESG